MTDLDLLARRAGAAARTEARARGRQLAAPGQRATVPSPWRRPALAGLAVLVVAVLVVTGGRLLVETGIVIEPVGPAEEPGTLPVPTVGAVTAGYLEDGTPVFVSHPEDGTLLVLDATSPHLDNKLVAYCQSSGWFEDLYHGSRWTGWGDWMGGPSPTGLRVLPHVLLDDGQHVRVTGPAGQGNERTQPRGPDDVEPHGPFCEPGYDDLSAAVGHRPPVEPVALDGGDVPSDRWVWASLVTGGSVSDQRVCDADGTCAADAPRVLPVPGTFDDADQRPEPTRGVYLARATGDGAVQLRRPALPVDGPVEGWPEGVLPIPAPGEVLAGYGWGDVPLFVVAEEDGTTFVFDATSPRHPTDLLGWCPGEGHFVDGSGARYDRSGEATDGGASMHRHDHAIAELGRGDLQVLRLISGARGWQPPRFTPEAIPRSAPQAAPCAQVIAHGPAAGDVEGVPDDWFDSDVGWRWMEATVREIDGEFRLCLDTETCDDPALIIVSPGVESIVWSDDPQLLHVRRDDGPDLGAATDREPHWVQLRRPLPPAGS